jgi:hypothetical protein
MRLLLPLIVALAAFSLRSTAQSPAAIPDDFPRFRVPGHEAEMASLRALFWLHYPGAGPKSTLWDDWLSGPSLWPATTNQNEVFRQQWRDTLGGRIMEPDGYVATHQHPSIAHQHGWPFPFWNQGQGGAGWHFSFKNTIGPGWRPDHLNRPDDWTLAGASAAGTNDDGWQLELTAPHATAAPPAQRIDAFQAPFLQLRWAATGLGHVQPFIEWTSGTEPEFSPDRRVYFEPVEGQAIAATMVALWRHPRWTNAVTRLRINFANAAPGGRVTLQAFFTQYDTRHNINSQNFVRGCATVFWWTGDLDFLRRNINRMRSALRYVMTEHQALTRNVVFTGWIGHDGRTGLRRNADGSKQILSGHGIGNNYWDLLPFGHLDCYATVQYYDALQAMLRLERDIATHPEWQVPGGVLAFDPDMLERHAAAVKAEGNRLFWNPETGRFVACVDADGLTHDYGFTFLNLEAVAMDFATAEHATSILNWVAGDRVVAGDTAQRADIYHWRFGPRATTRRNIDWYFWAWSGPETIPFGNQVQDGGAVLAFSYHDLLARLKVRGPDDTWQRLREVIRWFDEVQAAGGYRKYYDGKSRDGTMQGAGTPGGLGLDAEFFESVLVPQIMLNGFLGFAPRSDGFRIEPRLPRDWPELTIDRIRWHDLTLRVTATPTTIEVEKQGSTDEPVFVLLPAGRWRPVDESAAAVRQPRATDGAWEARWNSDGRVRFDRTGD